LSVRKKGVAKETKKVPDAKWRLRENESLEKRRRPCQNQNTEGGVARYMSGQGTPRRSKPFLGKKKKKCQEHET